VKQALIVSEI